MGPALPHTPSDLSTPVLVALEALRAAAAPPLTDPDAPVRLADLPAVWRAHLLDPPQSYHPLLPPGRMEVERADWEELLARVARELEHAFRMAGRLALAERGPTPEDLAQAPVLSPWAPALGRSGEFVLTGHVAGHPCLGEAWIRTSVLAGLDPQGRWARSWSRWYRLGEPMGEALWLDYGLARLPVRLIETDEALAARHFASLRQIVARVLEPLGAPVGGGRR